MNEIVEALSFSSSSWFSGLISDNTSFIFALLSMYLLIISSNFLRFSNVIYSLYASNPSYFTFLSSALFLLPNPVPKI